MTRVQGQPPGIHACVLEHLRTHLGRRGGERLLHRLRSKRVIDDASSRPRGWGKDLLGVGLRRWR